MGAFEYQALDPRGRTKKGVLEGDTARQIRQQLREQGLTPLAVAGVAAEKKEAGSDGGIRFTFKRGISATELALVTRQLATLVRSALPVEEALLAAAQQNESQRIKSMLLAVRARVLEGHTLAHGLGQFPQAFPEIFRATVAAGEQTGHLDAVLERLADYAESRQQLRQKLGLAMIYPILLTAMSIIIVAFLLTYVVPQVVTVFRNIGHELPFLTRALIALSNFLRADGIYLLIGIVVVGFGLYFWLKRPEPRRQFHRLLLKLPLIGRVVRGLNTSRFTRTLSILAGSGVPVLEALRIAGEVVSNVPMREAVDEAANRVREGSPINRALAVSGLFPPMTIHLIASGETSGQLRTMLDRAAQNQERELETLLATMLGILEPAMILIMGAVVLVIVLAIMLPIFDLNTLVH
ncbi:MAG TPA: type II secretion system inner membrane protein GspF [Gammaproteobacteria bacterium]|nr:type II secretion system inner membrane protein GspF [Gammaproteobacteria bacterium]